MGGSGSGGSCTSRRNIIAVLKKINRDSRAHCQLQYGSSRCAGSHRRTERNAYSAIERRAFHILLTHIQLRPVPGQGAVNAVRTPDLIRRSVCRNFQLCLNLEHLSSFRRGLTDDKA